MTRYCGTPDLFYKGASILIQSFNEWCLHFYNEAPLEHSLKYAQGSDAPVLDTMAKLVDLFDGYTLYLRANVVSKESLN